MMQGLVLLLFTWIATAFYVKLIGCTVFEGFMMMALTVLICRTKITGDPQ